MTDTRNQLNAESPSSEQPQYSGRVAAPDPLPPFPDEGRRLSPRKITQAVLIAHLADLPLFSNCSKKDLRHIARSTRLDLIDPDHVLFSEGESSREGYVVVAGRVIVRRNGRKIAEVDAGEFVGELGLLLDRDHSATATAATSVEVLVLSRAALREAVNEVPGLGWKLLQTVAHRMAENTTARGRALA